MFMTFGGAFEWKYRKQKSTAQSTTDAEYYTFGRTVIHTFLARIVRRDDMGAFGRLDNYFFTTETNGRGSLHAHGLLWLQGNISVEPLVSRLASDDSEDLPQQVIPFVEHITKNHLEHEPLVQPWAQQLTKVFNTT
jgi:hypothetical protein